MYNNPRVWKITTWPVLFFTFVYMVILPNWYDGVKAWANEAPAWEEDAVPNPVPLEYTWKTDADDDPVVGRGLLEKARQLGNHPVLIYEFVRNEIEYEAYSGCRFGAVGTLERGRGNDVDQALLLAALLRAGYKQLRRAEPELYFSRGDIELTGRQALAWLGVANGNAVDEYLKSTGVRFSLKGNPDTDTFKLILKDHVWLRGDLKFGEFRGTRFYEGSHGKLKVDLDPSFVMQEATAVVPLPFDLSGITAAEFVNQVDAFVSDKKDLANGSVSDIPEKFMLNQIDSGAAAFHRLLEAEKLTAEQALTKRKPTVEKIRSLPASLPYLLAKKPKQYELQDEGKREEFLASERHLVQIQIVDTTDEVVLANVIEPASKLYGKPLAIGFENPTQLQNADLNNDQVTTWTTQVEVEGQIFLNGEGLSQGTPPTIKYGAPVQLKITYQVPKVVETNRADPVDDLRADKSEFATVAGSMFALSSVPSLNTGNYDDYYNRALQQLQPDTFVGTDGWLKPAESPATALAPSLDLVAQIMHAQTENFFRLGALATGHQVSTIGEWALVGLQPTAFEDGAGNGFTTPQFIFASPQKTVSLGQTVENEDLRLQETTRVQSLLQLTREAILDHGPALSLGGHAIPVTAGRLIRDGNSAGLKTYVMDAANANNGDLVGQRVPAVAGNLESNLKANAAKGDTLLMPSAETVNEPEGEETEANSLGQGWGLFSRKAGNETWTDESRNTEGTAYRAFSAQYSSKKLKPGHLIANAQAEHYLDLANQLIYGVEAYEGAALSTGRAYVASAHPLAELLNYEADANAADKVSRLGSAVVLLHALLEEFSRPEVLSLEMDLSWMEGSQVVTRTLKAGDIFNPFLEIGSIDQYTSVVVRGEFNAIMETYNFAAYDGSNQSLGTFDNSAEGALKDLRTVEWVLKNDQSTTTVFDFAVVDPDNLYSGPVEFRLEGSAYGRNTRQLAKTFIVDCQPPNAHIVRWDDERQYRSMIAVRGIASDTYFSEYRLEKSKSDDLVNWTLMDVSATEKHSGSLYSWDSKAEAANGEYTFRLTATDKAGNTSTSLAAVDVHNDVWDPVVNLSPLESTQKGMLNLSVNATDNQANDSGIKRVKLWMEYTTGRYEKEDPSDPYKTLIVEDRRELLADEVFANPVGSWTLPTKSINTQLYQGYAQSPLRIVGEVIDDFGNLTVINDEKILTNKILNAYLTNGVIQSGTRTDLLVFTGNADPPQAKLWTGSLWANLTVKSYQPFLHNGQSTYMHFFLLNDNGTNVVTADPGESENYPIQVTESGETRNLDLFVYGGNDIPDAYVTAPLNTMLLKDQTAIVPIDGYVLSQALDDLNDRDDTLPIEKDLPASRPFWKLSYKPSSSDPVQNKATNQFSFIANYGYEENWIEIKHGFSQKHGDPWNQGEDPTTATLASWDISRVPIGNYDLRLVVTDGVVRNGSILYKTCFFPGYKIRDSRQIPGPDPDSRIPGALTLRQIDMNINFEGFPIEISRTYNSYRAMEKGLFGWGWDLDTIQITVSQSQKDNTTFGERLEADITLPDGRTFTYANRPPESGASSAAYADNAWMNEEAFIDRPYGQMLWLPGRINNSAYDWMGILNSVRKDTDGWQQVEAYLGSEPNGTIACLKQEDGTFLLFEWDSGKLLRRDYGDNKRRIDFEYLDTPGTPQNEKDDDIRIKDHLQRQLTAKRDDQGRVISIADARGFSYYYGYNELGELYELTDRAGNKRWLKYEDEDFPHYLTGMVIDRQADGESGHGEEDANDTVIAYEYTHDGKLQTIDTGAGTIAMEYQDDPNGSGSQKVIDESTGGATEVVYDSSGQVTKTNRLGGRNDGI